MIVNRSLRVVLALAALSAMPAPARAADAAAPQVMEAFPQDLQRAFEADRGKVRLVLLLAPS